MIEELNFNSVENVPGIEARAAFSVNSATVFKEDVDIVPTIIDETLSYIPWGGDNQLPYNVIDLIGRDETLATCQVFNAEVCFGYLRLTSLPSHGWKPFKYIRVSAKQVRAAEGKTSDRKSDGSILALSSNSVTSFHFATTSTEVGET